MLLRNEHNSSSDFIGYTVCRYIKNLFFMLAGVFLISVIALAISSLDSHNQSRVYAVDSHSGEDGILPYSQAGLMGLVNGVADMERYSEAVRLVDAASDNETVLAGVSGIERKALMRFTISQGTKTAAKLGYYAQQAVYENQMSADEYYTLLHIVEAEATGGDLMSKMLVAGVVLNRVRSEQFPSTIYEVVWEKAQFQPTADGRIYSCDITESTMEAVDRVLQGEDYSQGALFFVARKHAGSSDLAWFDSNLIWLYEYGGHDFYTFSEACG